MDQHTCIRASDGDSIIFALEGNNVEFDVKGHNIDFVKKVEEKHITKYVFSIVETKSFYYNEVVGFIRGKCKRIGCFDIKVINQKSHHYNNNTYRDQNDWNANSNWNNYATTYTKPLIDYSYSEKYVTLNRLVFKTMEPSKQKLDVEGGVFEEIDIQKFVLLNNPSDIFELENTNENEELIYQIGDPSLALVYVKFVKQDRSDCLASLIAKDVQLYTEYCEFTSSLIKPKPKSHFFGFFAR